MYDSAYQLVVTKDSVVEICRPGKPKVQGLFNHLIKLPGLDVFITRNDSLLLLKPKLPVNDRYEFVLNSKEKLIKHIAGELDVMFMDKEVPILRIAYKSAAPQQSADVVNAVSQAYISDYVEENSQLQIPLLISWTKK